MARSRTKAPPPQRLILDSGAIIGLARRDQRAVARLAAAHQAGALASIPAVVLAETLRGRATDAPVNRIVKFVDDVIAADAEVARTAGGLLGKAGSASTVDALVVASALAVGGGLVLTGDVKDLTTLSGPHPNVVIQPL